MIDRRALFGALGLLTAPRAGKAQEAGKTFRIGVLSASPAPGGTTTAQVRNSRKIYLVTPAGLATFAPRPLAGVIMIA